MNAHYTKTECDRCGTCCFKGGPALHFVDLALLQNNRLNLEQLITIRKGEPVFSLAAENLEPAKSEIIKLKGKGNEWTCLFYESKKANCAIYHHRPLECSLLKCWDPADLENVAGKNLLSRYDIITPNDPIVPFLKNQDEKCCLENLSQCLSSLNRVESRQQALIDLTGLVNNDLAIRSQACEKFDLTLDLELFFFGRPLFKILNQFNIRMYIVNGTCRLSY